LSTIQNTRRAERYGLLIHDLVDEATEWGFASLRLAAAKDDRPMHVPRRQVLHRALTLVLVFDARRVVRSRRECGVPSAASLDARLLIRTEHELVRPEWLTLPTAGVQVEDWAGEFQKSRVAREDPVLIAPRTQRILHQPAPDAAARGTVGRAQHVGGFNGELVQAVTAERHATCGWSFARQRHDQSAGGWRKHDGTATARSILQPVTPAEHEAGAPALHRGAAHPLLLRQPAGAESRGAAQNDARSTCQTLWRRGGPRPNRQASLLGSSQDNQRSRSDHAEPPSAAFYPARGSDRKPLPPIASPIGDWHTGRHASAPPSTGRLVVADRCPRPTGPA
jgi:hypothetical protein